MDKYDVEYRMRAIKDTCNIFDELLSYDTGDDYWKRCVCEASILYLEQDMYDEETQQCPEEISLCQAQIDVITYRLKPYKDVKKKVINASKVNEMIQKTSLEELKQMGHTYLNYVRRNSSKNPLEDWKLAVNYYYAGAAQGDAECAAAVGYCCEMDPRGPNLPLALAWYRHAAKAGSAWAMEKVATFYEEGYGCTANRALADACRETLKYMR